MTIQMHNLGFLRMAVEDALAAHLETLVTSAKVRAAFTTTEIEHPLVTVHAKNTRERNEQDYILPDMWTLRFVASHTPRKRRCCLRARHTSGLWPTFTMRCQMPIL